MSTMPIAEESRSNHIGGIPHQAEDPEKSIHGIEGTLTESHSFCAGINAEIRKLMLRECEESQTAVIWTGQVFREGCESPVRNALIEKRRCVKHSAAKEPHECKDSIQSAVKPEQSKPAKRRKRKALELGSLDTLDSIVDIKNTGLRNIGTLCSNDISSIWKGLF